ncbi:MAG TPA: response regulator [Thermoguttaceae bacterium]|nr:response regulator [Thermoguttaceae bacterium]
MSTMLVVDDRPENLFVLEQLIAEHLPECRVLTAGNAEDGLALAAANSPDVALLDVQMPGVDGIELCRRLKANPKLEHLPVLLITSHGSTTDLRIRGLEAGADDFVSRPIDNVELTAKIRVALRIKRAEDELRNVNMHLEELVAQRTKELKASRSFLQTVIDAMPEVTMVIDRDFRVLMVNRAAVEAAGGKDPQTSCLACYEVSHRSQVPCGQKETDPCPLEAVFSTKQPVTVDHLHYDNEGRKIFVEVQAAPIFDETGEVVQIVEACRDVTDRVMAQREREKALAELKTRNAELEQFAYTVSHDLKSPLITINGFLGLVQEDIEKRDFAETNENIARVVNATKKMHHLLDDVLELSRIGRIVNPPVDVPMAELAHSALDALAGRIAQKDVQVDIAADLPVLYGDRFRLEEVFQNLIENALKYTGDQLEPRIEIGARCDGEEDVYYVRDNGQGIDPRFHDRIFGLFDKLAPNSDGTGIGLALAKRIVEVHGGRIWVESEGTDRGSTFCFTLASKEESSVPDAHAVAQG